jgi:sirohydrochlorin cobaltochelatase
MIKPGIVLFGHGARDPRWAEPFHRLREIVAAERPDAVVTTAFLELMTPDLDAAADVLVADGATSLTVVPIFFGQGAHVRRDLPERIDALRSRRPDLPVTLAGAAGEDVDVLAALADYCLRVSG